MRMIVSKFYNLSITSLALYQISHGAASFYVKYLLVSMVALLFYKAFSKTSNGKYDSPLSKN